MLIEFGVISLYLPEFSENTLEVNIFSKYAKLSFIKSFLMKL